MNARPGLASLGEVGDIDGSGCCRGVGEINEMRDTRDLYKMDQLQGS